MESARINPKNPQGDYLLRPTYLLVVTTSYNRPPVPWTVWLLRTSWGTCRWVINRGRDWERLDPHTLPRHARFQNSSDGISLNADGGGGQILNWVRRRVNNKFKCLVKITEIYPLQKEKQRNEPLESDGNVDKIWILTLPISIMCLSSFSFTSPLLRSQVRPFTPQRLPEGEPLHLLRPLGP